MPAGLVCTAHVDGSRRLNVGIGSMTEKSEVAVLRPSEGFEPEALRDLYGSLKRPHGAAIASVLPTTTGMTKLTRESTSNSLQSRG